MTVSENTSTNGCPPLKRLNSVLPSTNDAQGQQEVIGRDTLNSRMESSRVQLLGESPHGPEAIRMSRNEMDHEIRQLNTAVKMIHDYGDHGTILKVARDLLLKANEMISILPSQLLKSQDGTHLFKTTLQLLSDTTGAFILTEKKFNELECLNGELFVCMWCGDILGVVRHGGCMSPSSLCIDCAYQLVTPSGGTDTEENEQC